MKLSRVVEDVMMPIGVIALMATLVLTLPWSLVFGLVAAFIEGLTR